MQIFENPVVKKLMAKQFKAYIADNGNINGIYVCVENNEIKFTEFNTNPSEQIEKLNKQISALKKVIYE